MNNSRHSLAHIIQLIVILIASVCLYFQIDAQVLDVKHLLANLILIITLVFQYFFIQQPIQKKNTDIVGDLNEKNLELFRLNEELKLSRKIISQSQRLFTDLSDNGIEIDLDIHEHKFFGMYKTFHGNKDARGIGLFITKNQVEAMRGKIEVQSKVDVGTTFKVFLSNKNDFFSNKNNKIVNEKN